MSFTAWVFAVGFVVSTLSFIFTLFRYLEERRDKRRETAKREKVEAEMREIQRRGRAPFLRPTFLHVPKIGDASNKIIAPTGWVNAETIPTGTTISLWVANDGEPVRDVTDDWSSPEGFQLYPGGWPQDATHATELNYRFDGAKHGQAQRITINFETLDGLKLYQTYETRHGFCELRRVDPA